MYIQNMGIDLGSKYAAELGFASLEVYVDETSTNVVTDIDENPGTGGCTGKKKKKKRKKKHKNLSDDCDEGNDNSD